MSGSTTPRRHPGVVAIPSPELARFWIEAAPRGWPSPAAPWVDLARARLGAPGSGIGIDTAPPAGEGRLHLPPVEPGVATRRDELAVRCLGEGTPVVLQIQANGEDETGLEADACSIVVDALPAVLSGAIGRLARVPAGCTVAWPLIPGLGDEAGMWEEGCTAAASAGARCVHAVVLDLPARDRQALLLHVDPARRERVFDRLFHARPRAERDLARCAAGHGLESFFLPAAAGDARRHQNRSLAETLGLAAEVWLRLGRSEARAHELFRAARWARRSSLDLRAVAREGNVEVVSWLGRSGRGIWKEWAESGRSPTLAGWIDAWRRAPEEEEER